MSTIATTFTTQLEADAAYAELRGIGFEPERLSMLMSEDAHGKHFRMTEGSRVAEGTIGGGIAGGALGALVAGLVAVGVIALPGVGLVAAGPIVAALAGAGAGGVSGGLIGGLVGMGVPEHEAKVLGEKVTRGGILMAVEVNSSREEEQAREILHRHTEAKLSEVGS